MSFLNTVFWGARLWIWLYLFLSMALMAVVIIYFYKELIRKKYYEIKSPQELIKIVIHFPSGMFKEYWRLIPDSKFLVIANKQYPYDDKNLIRNNDNFVRNPETIKPYFEVNGKKYYIDDLAKLKKRFTKYPEIHYFFNIPAPINFDYDDKEINLSSAQLESFKKNDLFNKLLNIESEKKLLTVIFIMIIVNFLATAFILAKLMGWLEK